MHTHIYEHSFLDGARQIVAAGAGFTTPEVVKKIDSDEQDEPKQGLEALLAQFQGIAPKDPLFAVIAYRDHKPSQV